MNDTLYDATGSACTIASQEHACRDACVSDMPKGDSRMKAAMNVYQVDKEVQPLSWATATTMYVPDMPELRSDPSKDASSESEVTEIEEKPCAVFESLLKGCWDVTFEEPEKFGGLAVVMRAYARSVLLGAYATSINKLCSWFTDPAYEVRVVFLGSDEGADTVATGRAAVREEMKRMDTAADVVCDLHRMLFMKPGSSSALSTAGHAEEFA